jgi:hypothetical protein
MSVMTSSVKVKGIQTQLSSTAKDDSEGGGWYDDFLSELNFEGGGWDNSGASTSGGGGNYDVSNRSRAGRGGRSNGGRSSGTSSSSSRTGIRNDYSHDYQRDTTRDASFIPEETMPIIENLLASRLDYRKRRMYVKADGIRDELLNEHGVPVWDREKTWSTGGGGACLDFISDPMS